MCVCEGERVYVGAKQREHVGLPVNGIKLFNHKFLRCLAGTFCPPSLFLSRAPRFLISLIRAPLFRGNDSKACETQTRDGELSWLPRSAVSLIKFLIRDDREARKRVQCGLEFSFADEVSSRVTFDNAIARGAFRGAFRDVSSSAERFDAKRGIPPVIRKRGGNRGREPISRIGRVTERGSFVHPTRFMCEFARAQGARERVIQQQLPDATRGESRTSKEKRRKCQRHRGEASWPIRSLSLPLREVDGSLRSSARRIASGYRNSNNNQLSM